MITVYYIFMNLKVYKVQFYADVGRLRIKTPIACSITGSWKRSKHSGSYLGAEVAKTTTVEFSNGEANFDQTIAIPVNMYYEENSYTFQEKKVNMGGFVEFVLVYVAYAERG
jgi:hypothetical protein